MKIFVKKISYLSIGLVAYAISDPVLTKIIGQNVLPTSDIYLVIGVGIFLITTICLLILDKTQSLKEKIIKSFIALLFFVLALGLSVYLSLVVWISLGLPY